MLEEVCFYGPRSCTCAEDVTRAEGMPHLRSRFLRNRSVIWSATKFQSNFYKLDFSKQKMHVQTKSLWLKKVNACS